MVMAGADKSVEMVTELPRLAPRVPASNKGDFGRVLVVAGSRGMSGAAILCASAALRGGAGLVKLAVPHEILPIVAAANPCYTTLPLPQDGGGRLAPVALAEIVAEARTQTVVAVGPGLGRSDTLGTLLANLLEQVSLPIVLDADGINAFASQPARLGSASGAARIITPHPGEFARLVQMEIREVQGRRQELALQFAHAHQLIVVLKGHQTLVTDGRRLYRNSTGNPGLATGGTGDVLTGLIAALLGQKLEPFAAAQLGTYLHGLAGDLARDQLGEVSLIASDLLSFMPAAFRCFQAGR
jgi:ADP-dependent NAD(P)H-hydrate dehydratase